MSGVREMKHPQHEIEDHDEGLMLRFRVPGSSLGPVAIVLSLDEADEVVGALEQAISFAEAGDA